MEKKEGQAMPMTCEGAGFDWILTVTGDVDHHGAKGLMAQIDRELESALARNVTVDLSGVSFMDSSGIAVLLRIYRRTAEVGGRVTVRGTPAQAMKVLRTAGLSKLMEIE